MSASATEPSGRLMVNPGETLSAEVVIATSAVESGKVGALSITEAFLSIAGVSESLMSETLVDFVELATPVVSGASATVSGTPTYSAGGGPSSENIYVVTVSSSTGFVVGDYVRGADQPDGQGGVYKILAIPDASTLHLHCGSGDMDIVSGDTVEEVNPTGMYRGAIEFDVDDYLDIASPGGRLSLVVTARSTGDDPAFAAAAYIGFTRTVMLDVSAFKIEG